MSFIISVSVLTVITGDKSDNRSKKNDKKELKKNIRLKKINV